MVWHGKGRAIGGPLNGIELIAGSLWDGRIKYENKDRSEYHNGYYEWDTIRRTWVWHWGPRSPYLAL